MDDSATIELARQALLQCLAIGGPLLAIGLTVGVLVSLIQTLTHVHDATVGFVPKLIVLILAIAISMPWLFERLADYSRDAFGRAPTAAHNPRFP